MFLAFPSLHSNIFASSGSMAFTNSTFFMAPMDWFWLASRDEGVKPPRRSSNAFEETLGFTPPTLLVLDELSLNKNDGHGVMAKIKIGQNPKYPNKSRNHALEGEFNAQVFPPCHKNVFAAKLRLVEGAEANLLTFREYPVYEGIQICFAPFNKKYMMNRINV